MPRAIEILKKETAYLNELSSDVIGYIESQELITVKEMLSLKTFIHADVCPLIRVEKPVELKYLISDTQEIEFNPMALKKILVNLLHNATKYTKEGTITLMAKENLITIEDTGMGIAPEFKERIFEPFVGLDKSRNRKKSGFGLGLSIARNLAESNGYELFLDANYLNGCRFILKKK